jgi:hypothetical protein
LIPYLQCFSSNSKKNGNKSKQKRVILADKGFHAFDADPLTPDSRKIAHVWVVIADYREAQIYRKTR